MSENTTILLTGGSGFIGRHLIDFFSKNNNKFLAPSHSELDLTDSSAVKKYILKNSIGIVIHTANVGGSRKNLDTREIYEKNILMFVNLAACENELERIIFLGSGAEYDKSQPIVKVTESDFGKSVPKDSYGLSKYECSKKIEQMRNCINLRCFGVYGTYEDYEVRFISYAILRALLSLPIIIKQNVLFEYVYVKDLCRVINFFLNTRTRAKFLNVGTGHPILLSELAEIVKNFINSGSEIQILNHNLGKEYSCDSKKLLAELKDFKFTSHKIAISEMVDWYKSQLGRLDLKRIKTLNPL